MSVESEMPATVGGGGDAQEVLGGPDVELLAEGAALGNLGGAREFDGGADEGLDLDVAGVVGHAERGRDGAQVGGGGDVVEGVDGAVAAVVEGEAAEGVGDDAGGDVFRRDGHNFWSAV